MSALTYKVLHIFAVLLTFTALGAGIAGARHQRAQDRGVVAREARRCKERVRVEARLPQEGTRHQIARGRGGCDVAEDLVGLLNRWERSFKQGTKSKFALHVNGAKLPVG